MEEEEKKENKRYFLFFKPFLTGGSERQKIQRGEYWNDVCKSCGCPFAGTWQNSCDGALKNYLSVRKMTMMSEHMSTWSWLGADRKCENLNENVNIWGRLKK